MEERTPIGSELHDLLNTSAVSSARKHNIEKAVPLFSAREEEVGERPFVKLMRVDSFDKSTLAQVRTLNN